ncbi:MAG: DUF4261 domain-containing protein [Thermoplasmata archaeon]|nr:DUF4261 domain-containing protein [Thermoplasmata archaeon]
MSGESGLLRPQDIEGFESYMEGDAGNFHAMLESIGRTISEGIAEGRFTEKQAHEDLDIALWIGYACNNIDDYEHYLTAVEWLSRVERSASGCGVWYYRYANALLYIGKPRLAMEYLSRGVDEDPDYPWCWLTLGRLRAHFGDREGAIAAAMRGLQIVPDDAEFNRLLDDISAGRSLEEMEFHFIGDERDDTLGDDVHEAFWYEDGEPSLRAEAVMGMAVDPEGLAEVKEALSPTGWIPDHPYCTYMLDTPSGQVMVTFAMNEAFISKMPADDLRRIIDSIPEMEKEAREVLGERAATRPLYGVMVDRRLRPTLSFGGFEDDSPVIVSFDEELRVMRQDTMGGPFIAIVLLSDPSADLELVRAALQSDWGIKTPEPDGDDSLVFECDGHLAAYSLVRHPVPDGEAEENAANNFLWPEGVEEVSRHRAHLMVALVNHSGSPVDAALMHAKLVAAACSLGNAIGVYFQGTVLSPEMYLAEAMRMKSGELPVGCWIWVGLYSTPEGGISSYTQGLEAFGRDEIEVLNADAPPEKVMRFVCGVLQYLLETDVVLDGIDTIGYSDEENLSVEHGPGVSIEGNSFKISYPKHP